MLHPNENERRSATLNLLFENLTLNPLRVNGADLMSG
jgi:hypothetical protein